MHASRVLVLLLLSLASPLLYADELSKALADAKEKCDGEGSDIFMASKEGQLIEAHARTQIAQAEKQEQAGDTRAAYETLQKISSCISDQSNKRIQAMKILLGKKLGDEEEKKGRLAEAFDWFVKSKSTDDADRVMMKRAQAQPEDRSTFSTAFDYFKGRGVASSIRTLRALAMQNAKKLLASEEKQFAANRDSLDTLSKAKDWLFYAEAPENRLAVERAEKRGDTLSAETTRHFLRLSISYYDFADMPAKTKSVRDKARKLGDEAKGKGEGESAAEYYQIAGMQAQAHDVQKRTEAKQREDEGKRQKQFKKDQDSLEKELGM